MNIWVDVCSIKEESAKYVWALLPASVVRKELWDSWENVLKAGTRHWLTGSIQEGEQHMLYDIHTTPLDPTPCLNPSWLRSRGRELMLQEVKWE